MPPNIIDPQRAHERGRVAALSRSRPADDPELIEARRNLAACGLEEYVQKLIANWPPLSPEQLERITGLLTAGGAA